MRTALGVLWRGAADQYTAIFEACAAQPACRAAYPNLRAELTAAVQRLDRSPLTVQVPGTAGAPATTVVFDGYRTADLPVVRILPRYGLATVPAMPHALAAGDGTAAARTGAGQPVPARVVGWGLFYGVICREEAAFTDPQKVQAAAKAALPEFPDRVLALLPQQEFSSRIFADCAAWDVGRADARVATQTRSEVPALLMSGSFDAAAAPRYSAAAAEGLSHSSFPDSVATRFSNPSAPAHTGQLFNQLSGGYDTSCVDNLTVPPFTTG